MEKVLKHFRGLGERAKTAKTKGIEVYKKSNSKKRLSVKEQTFFIKRLSFLVKAGMPILESLHVIRDQTKSGTQSKILDTVIHDVSNGHTLSKSLGQFRKTFGDFSINIISFGESTGILSENLEYLADELRKKQALRKKVLGALVYPAIVTIATFGIVGFLMFYLFPKIIPVFTSLHATLPITTRFLIWFSNFLTSYGVFVLAFLVGFTIGFSILMARNKTFHYYINRYVLKIPMIGEATKNYNLANGTRTLGLLLRSGITVSDALPITAKTTSNLVYKEGFEKMSEIINRGEKISFYLAKRPDIFPDVVTQIISVGERSGNLSNSFIYLSEMYEAEVEDFTKNISTLIEPVLMIFMGVMVGFIAISIITPIYGITQYLQVK